MCTITRLTGVAIASMGLAHFARPEAFESITRTAFPDNTRQHVAINGGIESLLGVGLATPRTRRPAVIASLGYLAYLVANLIRSSG